jgi:Na+/melibiose symporter-like transporter
LGDQPPAPPPAPPAPPAPADIIDYDELHTGQRNEGLYTVVETNLQQFIEIPSGTVPFLIFSYLGYVSNSGRRGITIDPQ